MNTVIFSAWIEQVLIPTLVLGDIVIMDNLSVYKSPSIDTAIRAARTVDALWNAIASLVDRFFPQGCRNYLRSSGYRRSA